jgi:hypothetical protein
VNRSAYRRSYAPATLPSRSLLAFLFPLLLGLAAAGAFLAMARAGHVTLAQGEPEAVSYPASAPPGQPATTSPEPCSDRQTVAILVDDYAPQPRPCDAFWPHNRLGGDRGAIDAPGGGNVAWGQGRVTATVAAGMDTWPGVWTSLNHPICDCTPLDFSAIFPPQIASTY